MIPTEMDRVLVMVACMLVAAVGVTAPQVAPLTATTTKEYCNMEPFNATCRDNEVVVMATARYGRMNLGRCVRGSYGYLGCAVDVLRLMDSKCSGRRTCGFKVPDPVMYDMQPCPGDFTSYLEAAFYCVAVTSGDGGDCERHKAVKMTSPSGFLSTVTAEDHGSGSARCPWTVEALPVQRINITLFNFVSMGNKMAPENVNIPRPDVCFEIGVVSDGDVKKTVTVCEGDPREATVMVSRGTVVQIEITNPKLLRAIGVFLFKYRVLGCPDAKGGPDLWQHRDEDSLTLRCNTTEQSWHLTCRDNTWIGETGNCSTHPGPDGWSLEHMFNADDSFPFGVLIAVAIGVAMGVVIGGVLLCLITMSMKKRRRNLQGYAQPKEQHVFLSYPSTDPATAAAAIAGSGFHCGDNVIASDWLMDGQYTGNRFVRSANAGSTILGRAGVGPGGGSVDIAVRHLVNDDSLSLECTFDNSPSYLLAQNPASCGSSFRPKSHLYECPQLA